MFIMRGPAPRAKKRVEAVENNVHAVAEAFELFLTLDGAGHIEMEIERHQLERVALQFAIIANGHYEIKAVNGDSLPAALFDFLTQPFARDLSPDFLANEGSLFVANPTCLTRENENRITGERDQRVDVTMDNFEIGHVAHSAFEAGVLVAADDQGIDPFRFHGRANIFVAALNFVLAGHLSANLWLMRPADFGGGESIHFRRVHESFDGDFFAFGIARAAGRAVIERFDSTASHHRSVRLPENGCMLGWDSDASVMTRFGIETLNYGPSSGPRDAEGEKVAIETLVNTTKVYALAAAEICGAH